MKSYFVVFICLSIFGEVAGIAPMNPASRHVLKRKIIKFPQPSPGGNGDHKLHRFVQHISSHLMSGDRKFPKHAPIEQNSSNRKSGILMNGYRRPQIDWARALMEGPQYSNFRQAMPKQIPQAQNPYQSYHQPLPSHDPYQTQPPPVHVPHQPQPAPTQYPYQQQPSRSSAPHQPPPSPLLQKLYLPPYITHSPYHQLARQNLHENTQTTEEPSQELHIPTASVVHAESRHNASSPPVHKRRELHEENEEAKKNEESVENTMNSKENEEPREREDTQTTQESDGSEEAGESDRANDDKAGEQSEAIQRKNGAQTTIYEAIIIPKQVDQKEIDELISLAGMSGKRKLPATKEDINDIEENSNEDRGRSDDNVEEDRVDKEEVKDGYYEETKDEEAYDNKKEGNDDGENKSETSAENKYDEEESDDNNDEEDKEWAENNNEEDKEGEDSDEKDKKEEASDEDKSDNREKADEDHLSRKVIDVKESANEDNDNKDENKDNGKDNDTSQEQKENLLTEKIVAILNAAPAKGLSPIDDLGKAQKALLLPAP